jgi:predicted Rossmann-fold nucleotide-binding protein
VLYHQRIIRVSQEAVAARLKQLSTYSQQHPQADPESAKMANVKELFSLEGQTALVTGGTRGIGQAMAIALAEAGADILLVQVTSPNVQFS